MCINFVSGIVVISYLSQLIRFSSVVQSCLTLYDPMDRSMPGFPVCYQLPELSQTHVHRVGDDIQPSHSLSSLFSHFQSIPASGAFPMSQFFASGGQSIGVSASTLALPMNIQDLFSLGWTGWTSLLSKGISGVFSNTTVQKNRFFDAVFFIVQLSHPYMTTGETIALARWTSVAK